MAKRTEEEKLTQAPLEIVLGGETYEVKLLVIRDARPWRTRAAALIASLTGAVAGDSDDPEQFLSGFRAILVETSDEIIDLFFDYAKDLDREEIEAKATEQEIAKGFNQLIGVAFPLAQVLGGAGMAQRPQPPQENRATRRAREKASP